jgi:hypothetical protein
MQSTASLIELLTFAWFLGVTFLPAAGEWNALDKVFVLPTVVWCWYLIACMYTALTFKEFKPCRRPWRERDNSDVRHCSNTCGCVTIVVWTLFGVLYFASLMNMANPMSIHLPTLESPCGRSSCVAQENVQAVVNPNGFFTSYEMPYDAWQAITCIFEDCYFANGTSDGVLGYPPLDGSSVPNTDAPPCPASEPCVATFRSQDYPNPGIGLADGYIPGLNESNTNTAICQGNVMVAGVNMGRRPCPYCYAYWKANYGYNPPSLAHCGTATDSLNAWAVCAKGGYCPNIESVRTRDSTIYQFNCSIQLLLIVIVRWGLYEVLGALCARRVAKREYVVSQIKAE